MRPTGPFCHQQCELVNVPIFPGDLLPFVAVIAGAPMWEKGRVRPRLRRISMSDQRGFISADQFHPDRYTQSRTAERTLNAAIVHADITRSYEEYLEIFERFMPTMSRGAAKPRKSRFAERRACAHLFSASWFHVMRWPRSVVCQYPFDKRRFLEMLSTRPILRGHWSRSGRQARSAL